MDILHQMLNKDNFHHITDQTILFNAARGGVIVEEIWEKTKTLENVIDCWENEPNINKNLQKTAYLALPHIAGHSIDAKFMGSFMIYEALCEFLNEEPKETIKELINPGLLQLKSNNLLDSINEIYDFKQDAAAIPSVEDFEYYRRNYPIRYEWHHYQSKVNLPIVT